MMFRSRFTRPKPNLSAAKKSQVTVKQSVSGSEDEKSSNTQKSGSAVAGNAALQSQLPASTPQPSATQSTPPQPMRSPSPRKTPLESVKISVCEPDQPANTCAPIVAENDNVNTLNVTVPSKEIRLSEHRSRFCPSADRSSDGERDESPLFIPKPSDNPPVPVSVNQQPAAKVSPAKVKCKESSGKRKRMPVHRTDLDEVYADSENSDGDGSVASEGTKKTHNLADILMRKGVRKQPSEPRYRPVVQRIGDTNSAPMDRSTVTMRDLIYYTNRNNPPPTYRQEREMKQYGKLKCAWYSEENAEKTSLFEDKATADGDKVQKTTTAESTSSFAEEQVVNETKEDKGKEKKKKETGGQAQFILDADGNIVLNEESLVIRREYTDDDYIDIQQDGVMGTATYSSFRKQKPRSKKWSLRETIRLYKALSTVGTDFSFMSRLFKYRTREEIKRKFKREEKARPTIIDRVLSNRKHFDLSLLDDTSDSEKSNSSSDSEAIQDAVLDSDNPVPELCGPNGPRFRRSRGRGYRRQKRYKCIDVESGETIPANPKWHLSKTAYRQDDNASNNKRKKTDNNSPGSKRIKIDNSIVHGAMTEALQNFESKHLPSTSSVQHVPGLSASTSLPGNASPAPSSNSRPASRAGSIGMEDVLTRLIDQKMRDLNERTSLSPSPLRRSRELSPPPHQPTVRNQSLSLDDFCKHEANLQS